MTAAVVLGDHAFEAGALVAAEGGEPRDLDQVGDARAVVLLDQAVELDEGHAEALGQHASERRLAGAAQADQRNAPRAVGGEIGRGAALDQIGDRGKLGRRHAREQVEDAVEGFAAAAAARQQLDHRHVERLGDALEDRSPTGCPARSRSARDSAPTRPTARPAAGASCRAWRAPSAPGRRPRRQRRRQRLGRRAVCVSRDFGLDFGPAIGIHLHYNACTIMQVTGRPQPL